MTYSDKLVIFAKAWEGLKLTASRDPLVPRVTDIGYGHVLLPSDPMTTVTVAEAHELLIGDLEIASEGVTGLVRVAIAQCMHDALCSFAFNLGRGALSRSTLLGMVNLQRFEDAANEFGRWVYASGKVANGLVKRRKAERAMFINGDYGGRP